MRHQLKTLVDRALPELLVDLKLVDFSVQDAAYDIEIPKIKAHGDLSVNLAFQLGRRLKKNPLDIAARFHKILEKKIEQDKTLKGLVKTITVEKPGFINFKFTEISLAARLLEISKAGETYGRSQTGKGSKVLIEFVSANPTGPLTIAHGRQAAIGDALARILTAGGEQVHKEFYLNDAGRQIDLYRQSVAERLKEKLRLEFKIPEEGYFGEYVAASAQGFHSKHPNLKPEDFLNPANAVFQEVIQERLDEIKEDLKKMEVVFDEYYSEKSLYEKKRVDQALQKLKDKGYLYESDGALWFRSTDLGDDKDRVIRKQTGDYTYLAPDIAYHEEKFRRGFKRLVNLLGPDHHGYIGRIKAACQALGYPSEQLHILIVQLVTLYRAGEQVRMSKRAGEYVTLRELIDEVGSDAARFFFLMRKVDSHLDFDLELAKKKSDENPVYYLQYAHARICNILAKASIPVDLDADLSLIREEEALDLIRKMLEYPEALKQAAEHLEPYRVVDYLRELAAIFHKFYSIHRVVSENAPLTQARLLLVDCVRIVLRNGLSVLGVSAPQKM
jgi:arginyl-tRNA synthetase